MRMRKARAGSREVNIPALSLTHQQTSHHLQDHPHVPLCVPAETPAFYSSMGWRFVQDRRTAHASKGPN